MAAVRVLAFLAVALLAGAEQASMMASRGTLREKASGCAATATCCPAMQMFVATCPHQGGVCCGATGYCCPADFKCHVSGATASCVKKVAVLPDVNQVLPIVSAKRKINMLPPGHTQHIVERRPDGTVVTTTTTSERVAAKKAKQPQPVAYAAPVGGPGPVSMKAFRELERAAHERAEKKIRQIKKKARKLKSRAARGRNSRKKVGGRRKKAAGKRQKGKRLRRLPPPPRQKKGSAMFPSDGVKGPSKAKKLAAKVRKLKKKEKKAKVAEKKALKKAGVRGSKRGGRRGRGRGRRGGSRGACSGNGCGTPHRVKLNAQTDIIIGKPKNTLPAKKK